MRVGAGMAMCPPVSQSVNRGIFVVFAFLPLISVFHVLFLCRRLFISWGSLIAHYCLPPLNPSITNTANRPVGTGRLLIRLPGAWRESV